MIYLSRSAIFNNCLQYNRHSNKRLFHLETPLKPLRAVHHHRNEEQILFADPTLLALDNPPWLNDAPMWKEYYERTGLSIAMVVDQNYA